MRKLYFSLLLCFLPLSAVLADEVVRIGSAEALRALATAVNAGDDYAGKTVLLTADIDLNNAEWTPIGTKDAPFNGTFDGQGHWVERLSVNVEGQATEDESAGFFGCVGASGTVRRLMVKSGSVRVKSKRDDDVNCYVGGIVGLNGGHIEQCANYATVLGNQKMANVGGIAGANGKIGGGQNVGLIEDCYNRGNIRTSTQDFTYRNYLGGIVGNTDGTVQRVYSSGEVDEAAQSGDIYGDMGPTASVEGAYSSADRVITGFALDGSLNPQGGYSVWTFTEGELPELTCFTRPSVTLENYATDNSATLATYDGLTCNVTIHERTFYKDDTWNTLTLPFYVDGFAGTPFDGASVMELDNIDFNDGTLTLNFVPVTSMLPGRPYIVKWAEGDNVTNPVFSGVTIENGRPTGAVFGDMLTFVGNYGLITLSANDRKKLYIGSNNTIYYPSVNVRVGAFRAYFELGDALIAGEPRTGNEVNRFVMSFWNEPDAILELPFTQSDGQSASSDDWFAPDGRHLQGKPQARGLYMNNGKKIIIK